MNLTFKQYEDMTNIVDSMELPSYTTICDLTTEDGYAEIRVQGEVKIDFDGNTYRCPTEFPDALKEIIHRGGLWRIPENDIEVAKIKGYDTIYIDMNNWFEIFWGDSEKDCYTNYDVIDIEGFSAEKLLSTCLECIKWHKECKEKESSNGEC